jgi:lysozyme
VINDMKISNKGCIEICQYEGLILRPYLDTEKVWTIGLGHTDNDAGLKPSKMNPAEFISAQKAVDMFKEDILSYVDRVNKYITSPLTQNQFDALVSFDYNTGGISHATLTKKVNEGADANTIITAFMMWTANKELVKRRTNEKNLFIYGTYVSKGTCLLEQTDGRGHISGNGARNFNIAEYFTD